MLEWCASCNFDTTRTALVREMCDCIDDLKYADDEDVANAAYVAAFNVAYHSPPAKAPPAPFTNPFKIGGGVGAIDSLRF